MNVGCKNTHYFLKQQKVGVNFALILLFNYGTRVFSPRWGRLFIVDNSEKSVDKCVDNLWKTSLVIHIINIGWGRGWITGRLLSGFPQIYPHRNRRGDNVLRRLSTKRTPYHHHYFFYY